MRRKRAREACLPAEAGFSFANISAKVNIRKASIHHHFPSKAELVTVVVTEYREEARAGMQAMTRQMNDPLAELQAYVDYRATCIREGSSPFCICAMLSARAFNDANIFRTIVQPLLDNLTLRA
ncbi:TetR/AcrR family transcriptional regulator [Raoultella terrigena]|uniref:TetR/AcrR family transcriptional regulator n=1 Tax=Raoultella terrigena TaxID=577 RepID=UPI00349FB9A7